MDKGKKEMIDAAVRRAFLVELDGCDFLASFDYEEIAREYNGIGPSWLKEEIRKKISRYLEIFIPAALIHDMRYSLSDGMRAAFNFANYEFRDNCLKLADAAYPFWNWRRYRARAVAVILFDCVSSEAGWMTWRWAYEKKVRNAADKTAATQDLTRAGAQQTNQTDGGFHPSAPSSFPNSASLRENSSFAGIAIFAALFLFAGCATAPKAKDVNLKGMYANAATETVAIGTAKITMLPESLESFVAHYSEDTAWLRPSEKTHALDIYMTGTNCTSSASKVVDAICKAFVEKKTPTTVGQMSAEVEGASAAGTTPPEEITQGMK